MSSAPRKHLSRLVTLAATGLVVLATSGFSCGSGDGESSTGGAGGAAAGAGGATGGAGGATGGAGGATGGAGGATGGAGGATGGAGGAATGGAGGGTGGAATGGMGGMAMGGAAGGTGAPVSCMYGAKDNPNKAEISWTVEGASADSNFMRTMYTGETRILVTYRTNANPVLRQLTFGFGVPFVGLTPPPCTAFGAALFGVDEPAAGKTLAAVKGAIPSINISEDAACGLSIPMWPNWSLAADGSITITKVDGPNIEFDFTFPMAGSDKPDAKGKGSFTLKGHVKSPCYVTM